MRSARGSLAGIVTIFLALVGLIGDFTDVYLIGNEVTFAGLMLILPAFAAGALAAAPRIEAGERREMRLGEAATAAAVAAGAAGIVFALAVLLTDLIGVERIRAVFIKVSPQLMEFLSFGRSTLGGAVIIVVLSTVAGVAGGLLRVAPPTIRKPVSTALIVTALFGIPPARDPDRPRPARSGAGLALQPALRRFDLDRRRGGRRGERRREHPEHAIRGTGPRESLGAAGRGDGPAMSPLRLVLAAAVVGVLVAAPLLLGSVISEVLGTVMVFALLGIGLNIVVGYAGLLDLGYVFFFALGAYSLALLTGATLNAYGIPPEPAISGDLNFYVAIPIVMLIAAAAGVLVGGPVLRLRGDYLALVTLGLGEMVTVLIASPWLVPLVGGPSGMRGITDAAIGGLAFRDPQNFYYLALAFVGLAAFVSWRLASSRIGRAWTAMREDEQTADAMGISTTRFKLLAFAIGGAIGSLGGALFAVKIGSLTPASFQVIVSIQVLGLVILGGMGSIPGVARGRARPGGPARAAAGVRGVPPPRLRGGRRHGDDPASAGADPERPPQPRAPG